MAYIAFPFHITMKGTVEETGYREHIYQLLEQFIFTNPGERVNRPAFGAGVLQMVFNGNSPEVAIALQFQLQSALQQYFGQQIKVESLSVTSEDTTLIVKISYLILALKKLETVELRRSYVL